MFTKLQFNIILYTKRQVFPLRKRGMIFLQTRSLSFVLTFVTITAQFVPVRKRIFLMSNICNYQTDNVYSNLWALTHRWKRCCTFYNAGWKSIWFFFFFLSSPLIIMHVIMSAIFNSQQSPQHLIPNWHLRGLYKRSHKRRTQFVASDNCTKCHIIVEKSQNNTQPTQHYVHWLWHKVRFFFFFC